MNPDASRHRVLPWAEDLDTPRCPGALMLVVLALGMALWLAWVMPLGPSLVTNPLGALMAIVLIPVACAYAVPVVLLPWLAVQGLGRLIARSAPRS